MHHTPSNGKHHYPGEAPREASRFTDDPLREDAPERADNQIEHVLNLLYRGRWLILVTLLVIFSTVALYTYSLPEIYRANSLVLLSGASPGGSSSSAQSFGYVASNPFARSSVSLANQLLILRNSMDLARDVARRLRQREDLPDAGGSLTVLADGSLTLDELAGHIQRRVSFSAVSDETSAIRIWATSTAPAEAALLANLYTEEYIQLTRDASRTSLASKRTFLETQKAQRQDSLRAAEEALEGYLRRNNAMALNQELSNLVSQIGALEAERDAINLDLQTQRAELQLLEERLAQIDAGLAARISSTVDESLRSAQENLAFRQTEKRQILLRNPDLPPESDRLQEVNRTIDALQQRVERLAAEYIQEVRAAGGASAQGGEGQGQGFGTVIALQNQIARQRIAISGLQARLQVIGERLQEYQSELRGIPEQSMALARLERARQYAEQLYRMVTEALTTTRIEEQTEVGYAQTVRAAATPGAPISPKKVRNLLAGLFGGLFLGIGLALMRYALDKRLYTPEDLHERGLNVIGVTPDMDPLIKREYDGAGYVEEGGRRFATGLVALLNPLTAATESYRHLRTNIQFSFPDTSVETILVTSPNKGEGKSITAANLAVVMAQTGRRTLLVDADLRRPRIHKMLGLNREPGLVEHLFDQAPLDLEGAQALDTGIDHLYACPAGQSVPNPAELLGSESMRAFVREAHRHFDVVIFDTPPVLVATDAALLSTQCDATIVVTQAGATRTYELEQTLGSLTGVGATVIGTLLNRFDASMTYGYNYKYRYHAQNYYDEDDEDEDLSNRCSRLTRLLRR